MAAAFPEEVWRQARDAVVIDGASYEEVARRFRISLSAVQKRASAEDWQAKASQRRDRSADYSVHVHELKGKLLSKASQSLDPNDVHSWRSVEAAFPEHRYTSLTEAEKRTFVGQFIDGTIAYLEEHDAALLSKLQGHIRPLAEHLVATWRTA